MFDARNQDQLNLHPKEIVSYVWEPDGKTPHHQFSGDSLQFVHAELKQQGQPPPELAGRPIRARWDEPLETVVVEELDGTVIPSSTAFAFVYSAFYGSVIQPKKTPGKLRQMMGREGSSNDTEWISRCGAL